MVRTCERKKEKKREIEIEIVDVVSILSFFIFRIDIRGQKTFEEKIVGDGRIRRSKIGGG